MRVQARYKRGWGAWGETWHWGDLEGRNEDATYRIYYDAAQITVTHPGPKANSTFALYNAHGMLKLDMRSTAGVCMRVRHQETWRQPPARRRLAAQQLFQLPAGVTAHVALWDTVQHMN